MTYQVVFTHAALVKMAARQWDKAEITMRIRAGLAEQAEPDEFGPQELEFSMVQTDEKPIDQSEQLWFCSPLGVNAVQVDSGHFVELPAPKDGNFAEGGPFAGMKSIRVPVGDSDEDDLQ